MADVRAVKNGNWSDTTVWNTGALPTTADDVYSNTFTVNVDTSFQVLSLRNTSGTGITAGGTFNFNSGSISASLTSTTGIVPGATNLITVTANGGSVTISAPTTNAVSSTSNITVVAHTGTADLYMTASSITCPNITSAGTGYFINKSSAGNLYFNGTVNALSTIGINGIAAAILNSAGNVYIVGNVNGLSITPNQTNTVSTINVTGGSLFVTGDLYGGIGSFATVFATVRFAGTNLTHVGNIIGGTMQTINLVSATSVSLSGSISAGSSTAAIISSAAYILNHSGPISSSADSPAIVSSNTSATNIFTGPFINTNDTMAVQCADMVLTQDASTFWNFGNITLFSPEQLAFYPSASDIRQGTTYADGTVSGSLAMPPPSAVIAGTPTDNTTGSAVLTPAQLQDAVWGRDLAQMTETGSIGYRLSRSATTDSTGKQIASYLL